MKKLKKIFAIAGVIILVGMYAMTFITALFATESAHSMFLASIGATIIVPVFLYAYMLIYRVVYKNKDDNEQQNKEPSNKKAFDEIKNK